MTRIFRNTLGCLLLPACLAWGADTATGGYVDFGKFSPPTNGGEFVEVNVKSNLIAMVARLAKQSEPEIADALRGLQSVRVNVIALDDQNRAEIQTRLVKIRAELEAAHWERVVTAQRKEEDVGVYVKTRGEEAVEGVVVMVVEDNRKVVLVNVVGDIRPEKLTVIGERFNIEPLKHVGERVKKS
jgi:hypothetical protein